jgi:membrane fusion protein (multidrug efflux system)
MASRGSLNRLYRRLSLATRPDSRPSSLQPDHRPHSVKGLFVIVLIGTIATAALAADQPPARVAVTKVFEKEVAPTASLVGSVVFDQSAGISPEVSGLIADQRMIEGTVVRKGDVLIKLNTDFITKDMEVLNQQIAQVDARIENALKNLKRSETLFRQDATTEKSYDDLAFEAKDLQIEKQRLQVSLAKKKLELEKSVIRAPFNGLVLKRNKSQGEWVSPGDPICQLASLDDLVVRVAVSEDLMPYVRVGQSVALSVTAMDRELQGRVKIVVPDVDPKSKTFDVKVGIDYVPGLFQNMSARVNVPTGPVRKLKMIKRGALVRFQGKEYVYTVKEGQAKILPIQVSAVDGEYLGVEEPYIVAGMPVVIDGNERLRPDQPVTIVDNAGNQ